MGDSVYEPDGNVPPDFSWRGIAIEARRLNQHDATGRGLEVSAVPLVMKVRKVLAEAGPPQGQSYFVSFRFKRPLKPWKYLRPKILEALRSFDPPAAPFDELPRNAVCESFSMGFAAASAPFEHRFVLGGYLDYDSGGFIVAELIKNIELILVEKSRKVEPYRGNYACWWLALVDHIGYARLDEAEVRSLREHLRVPQGWDAILLLDPLDPHRSIELRGVPLSGE